MPNLNEAFKELELLDDTSFDLDDEEAIKRLDKFLNDEDEDLDTIEMIVDVDAETEDELKDSYVGEILLYCPVCHTIHYKKKEEVHQDEEDQNLYNIGEECPECKQVDGFEVKGMVAEYKPEETEVEKEVEETETEVDADDDTSLIDIKDEDEKVEEALKSKKLTESVKRSNRDLTTDSLERFIDGDFSRSLKDYNADESLKEIEDTDIETNLNESLLNEPDKVVVESTEKKVTRPKALVKRLSESFKNKKKALYEKLNVKNTAELKTLLAGKGEQTIQESFAKTLEGLGLKNIKFGKPLKEDEQRRPFQNSKYKDIIAKYFNYSVDWEFLDIVADIIDRIDFKDYKESEDKYEFIDEEVDSYLIWTADQWCVLETYVGAPSDLDSESWYESVSEFESDLEAICDEIVGKNADESLKEGLIEETWKGEDAIRDLIDRADSIYSDGNYGDLEDCVTQALDDGLIYSRDIWDLAEHYGVIDDSELIERFYEDLWNDVYSGVYENHKFDDEEEEETEEVDESLKEKLTPKNEGYTLLGKEDKNIEAYSNYYNAKKRAEELGLKEAEYGDVYGSNVAYCFWNKSGNRNDDEEVMCYYFFGEDGKPKHEVTSTELSQIAKAFGLSKEDIDDAEQAIDESLKKSLTEGEDFALQFIKSITEEDAKNNEFLGYLKSEYDKIKDDVVSFEYNEHFNQEYIFKTSDGKITTIAVYPNIESDDKADVIKYVDDVKVEEKTLTNADAQIKESLLKKKALKACKEGYIKKDESGKTFCSVDGKSWEECSEEEYAELDKGGYIRLEDGEVPCEECEDDFEELDEELFDKVINKYCAKMYENVDNYKTTKATAEGSKIVLEGRLTYKSGNSTRTKFIFESKKNKKGNIKLVGLNETFAKSNKAFQLIGSIKNKKFVTEGLVYNYKTTIDNEEKIVNGRVNSK